jgi:restriction endonuclease Mrr
MSEQRKVLDNLSGFEFEELMVDVFRHLDYKNVRQSSKTGDVGRDIIMEEPLDNGESRTVIVECKNTASVGRPVVQKLHSAVSTFSSNPDDKGMVVTTGRFTDPAQAYAAQVTANEQEAAIELLDGRRLRELGEEIGLDLYSGKIEVLCDEALRFSTSTDEVAGKVCREFKRVDNFDSTFFSDPAVNVALLPRLHVDVWIDATFETSVGQVNSIQEDDTFLVQAEKGKTDLAGMEEKQLIASNLNRTIEIDEDVWQEEFDTVERLHFGRAETDYKDWLVERLQERYTETVSYMGDNNVRYTKECEPSKADICIRDIRPVYLPLIETETSIEDYTYDFDYFQAYKEGFIRFDGIHRCVHCSKAQGTFTFCQNCGSINCNDHIKTERLTSEPVCVGCAVTDTFFWRTKYFYTQDNLERFRTYYEELPAYKKALENRPLIYSALATLLIAFAFSIYYLIV